MKHEKMASKKGFVFAFIVLLMPLIFLTNANSAEKPQYGGVLKIVDLAEGAQPIGAPWDVSGIDSKLNKPVVEPFLREDINGGYHPWLATKWDIDRDKKTITLYLRKGVKFHDGTDFNADAAVWSFNKALAAKRMKGFNSVEKIDDYTIRVNTDNYQNNFLNLLSSSVINPVSPTAFEKMGEEKAKWHPVGTGPFKFVSFERGAKLKFERWDGYWQEGKPYLDGIEYWFIRDPMTQQAAMKATGDEMVHVLGVTSAEQAAMMKASGFQVLSMSIGPISLIPDSVNADSPLADIRVRRAVSYGINRDAICKARGFGIWQPANQIPSPGNPGYVKDLDFGQYDPDKAKKLLAEAGYEKGLKLKIIAQPALVDRDTMVAVQRYLSQIGIDIELEFPDGGKYTAIKWTEGWRNSFICNHTRMLAQFNLSYNYYYQMESNSFLSMARAPGILEKVKASLATLEPDDALGQEITKMGADFAMFIPIAYVYEMYILQSNVHDSGYTEWSASTIFTPEKVWLSR